MTRLTAGGSPADVATATTEKTKLAGSNTQIRYQVVVPGTTARAFRTRTGNDQITGLVDAAGVALANDRVTADDFGQIPAFQLPEGLRLDVVWLDPDDTATDRFPVAVRFGPASADAAFATYDATSGQLTQGGSAIVVPGAPDLTDDGFDGVLVMGQSNSYFGSPLNTAKDIQDPRVWQWGYSNPDAGSAAIGVDPLGFVVAVPGHIAGATTFGRHVVRMLRGNRRIMLLPAALGSTGLVVTSGSYGGVTGTWDRTNSTPGTLNLYNNAVAMARAFLADNPRNRIATVLWMQGETDAVGNISQATYAAAFDDMVTALRTALSLPTLPVIVEGMRPAWIPTTAGAPAIAAAHEDTPRRLQNTWYVPGPPDNGQGIPDGIIHYNAGEQRTKGRNSADAYLRYVRANVLGTPPPAPLTVTLVQTAAGTVLASWTPGIGRVTAFTARWRKNGGSNTALTTAQAMARIGQVSGLAVGDVVVVDVAEVNEQGTSAYTSSAALTVVAAPNPPTALAAGTPQAFAVPLTWTAPATDGTHPVPDSMLLEKSTDGGATWAPITTVAGTATSGVASGLTPSTSYRLAVSSVGIGGTSARATVNVTTPAPTPIVDAVNAGPAAFARGPRRLRAAHTGAAIRVRRSSDNTEADIGFTSAGDLDTAALLTFCGSGSGYVTKIYDQSGNGRDEVMATVANQPRIVNAGAVDTRNSRPVPVYNGTSTYLARAAAAVAAGGAGTLCEVKAPATGVAGCSWSEGTTNVANRFYYLGSFISAGGKAQMGMVGDDGVFKGFTGSTTVAGTALKQTTGVDSGTLLSLFVGGVADGTLSITRPAFTSYNADYTGAAVSTSPSTYFSGYIAEQVAWPIALSTAQRQIAEQSQAYYYGTS